MLTDKINKLERGDIVEAPYVDSESYQVAGWLNEEILFLISIKDNKKLLINKKDIVRRLLTFSEIQKCTNESSLPITFNSYTSFKEIK
ncbi:MAG: hypothetical protein Q7T34_02135 [Candidatus Parcubacteria bacterium]|nr:hypothetical protein [Candidatus Parcubacteria bacterium]